MKFTMTKSKRMLGTVVVLAAAVAAWGGVQIFAAGEPPATARTAKAVKPAAPVFPGGMTKLARTYVNADQSAIAPMPGGGYPSGLVNVDSPTVIHCPAAPHHKCMLVVDTNVQVGVSGNATNLVFVIPQVDGGEISLGPYLGNVPTTQFWGYNWQDAALITPGNHLVVSRVGTDATALRAGYSVEYRVYTE